MSLQEPVTMAKLHTITDRKASDIHIKDGIIKTI